MLAARKIEWNECSGDIITNGYHRHRRDKNVQEVGLSEGGPTLYVVLPIRTLRIELAFITRQLVHHDAMRVTTTQYGDGQRL